MITATKVEEGILSKATYKKGLDDKIIQAGMFNDNASDIDRQKKLEELIRQGNEDEDEPDEECETEIPNDTQINEMLARSPEEFELFQKMDQEMYEREGKEARMAMIMEKRPGLKDYSRFNYRLIQDWEVPEWIKVKPVDPALEGDQMLVLGKRVRKTITNIDNLSEQQFLRAIEEGEDLQEVMRRENEKRERRLARGGSIYSEGEEEEDEVE